MKLLLVAFHAHVTMRVDTNLSVSAGSSNLERRGVKGKVHIRLLYKEKRHSGYGILADLSASVFAA